jgi:hypothetical protein
MSFLRHDFHASHASLGVRFMRRFRSSVLVAAGLLLASSCGQNTSGFTVADASRDAAVIDTAAPPSLDDGPVGGPPLNCSKLECKELACPRQHSTTISGTVYAPTLIDPDPLYNAIVYIPNTPTQPFTQGVACDHCGAPVSGSPIAVVLTGADGRFSIENAPVGDDIPLVIQIGRWRRVVSIPHVSACSTTELPPELTHLPRTQAEGDIPLMAIATGLFDPMECLLRKIGIDDSEFTPPTGGGRVHFYVQNGMNLSPPAPAASTLWSDLGTLDQYDLVLFPCEGAPNLKPVQATQNVIDYTSAGGRVMTTHFGYVWIYDAQSPFPSTAMWDVNQEPYPPDPLAALIDTSFPKGKAMADWLQNVGASPSYAMIDISEPRQDVDGVNSPPSQSWINSFSPSSTQHFTFDTPIGVKDAEQCGKVVFSDFHVVSDETVGAIFPTDCVDGPLSSQEKVLEFMFFDLASCIQNDALTPEPPPIH